jgi:hypothetical protein
LLALSFSAFDPRGYRALARMFGRFVRRNTSEGSKRQNA